MEQVMGIFSKKKVTLFDIVLQKTKEMNNALTGVIKPKLIHHKFIPIIDGNPKSPMIMGMGNNQHLIYYPKNSEPYLHQYEESIKFVEILSGEIFDKITEKVYRKGDKFKIYPKTNIQPYTKDVECTVKVIVSKIDSIWSQKCEE